MKRYGVGIFLATLCATGALNAESDDREPGARTVLGTENPELAAGARELLRGHAEDGIRLTRLGLDAATNDRERAAGLSNLCAGYLSLQEWETALDYCNDALEIGSRNWRALSNRALALIMLGEYPAARRDLDLALEIAPNASQVRRAESFYLDATDPVVPTIVIDDRRDPGDETSAKSP